MAAGNNKRNRWGSIKKTGYEPGIIKFYTGGKQAVRLTNREGLVFIIGTYKPEELLRVINDQLALNIKY